MELTYLNINKFPRVAQVPCSLIIISITSVFYIFSRKSIKRWKKKIIWNHIAWIDRPIMHKLITS